MKIKIFGLEKRKSDGVAPVLSHIIAGNSVKKLKYVDKDIGIRYIFLLLIHIENKPYMILLIKLDIIKK